MKNFVLVFLLFFFNCHNINTSKKKYQGFSSELWKEDSLGCIGYRLKVAQNILRYQKEMLGDNSTSFMNYFGPPNKTLPLYNGEMRYFYYIEYGRQCEDNLFDKNLAVSELYVDFDKSMKVKKIGITIP